ARRAKREVGIRNEEVRKSEVFGRPTAMKYSLALVTFGALLAVPLAGQSGKVYIVQTNSAGDSVSLIDPATDKVVAEVPEAEVIHGAAVAPDGSRLYLSDEALDTVDVVETKTMRITKRIPLTGRPNNLSI